MIINLTLFYMFSSLGIVSSLMVILSRNPVYSVLFLILSFCNVSSLLFLLRLEFLPIAFLVIYVGAIAVLFLFVMMMLNIKLAELKEDNFHYIPLALFFAFVFVLELFVLLRSEFVPLIISNKAHLTFLSDFVSVSSSISDFSSWYEYAHNMQSLGQVLFTEYFYQFIISGFILLLAMVGAIVLTLQKKFVAKSQNIYAQVLRDFRTSIVRYS